MAPSEKTQWESPWQQLPGGIRGGRRHQAPGTSSPWESKEGREDSEGTDTGSQPGVWGAELGG